MIRFYILSAILLLSSCSPTKENSIDTIAGTYKYIEHPGDTIVCKNWGEKYWEMEIQKDTSKLSYIETGRGINSFELLTKIEFDGNLLYVKFNNVIYKAFLAPQEIDSLKDGDLLMTCEIKNNELVTRSEFLTTTLDTTNNKVSSFKFIKIKK